MINNAVNGTLDIDGTTMDYISFGKGKRNLVVILGLQDGMKTVKGSAVQLSMMFPKFGEEFRVYAFSQKNGLPEGFTTRDMAEDVYRAMKQVHIESADVIGVSMGGMIAQYLAIDHPEVVKKLVLVVTLSQPNHVVRANAGNWISMIESGDYRSYMKDSAEKMYTEGYQRKHRLLFSLIGNFGKPDDFSRFRTMLNACLTHNSYDELDKIKCPTLIIGGMKDRIVTGRASVEIAEKIPGSRLFIYGELGHGLFQEAKDFQNRIISFLNRS